MENPFDRALRSVQDEDARRRAQRKVDRAASMAREEQERQRLRSIVDPYLRSIAPSVRDALLRSGIQPQQKQLTYEEKMRDHRLRDQRPHWHLGHYLRNEPGTGAPTSTSTTTDLCLTADGYFTKSRELPGPQGYEELLAEVKYIEQRPTTSSVHRGGPVFVEEGTDRVCVAVAFNHGGRAETPDVRVWEFAEYVAKQVHQLQQRK